ncbi:crossover junction endodeoxyribonuclease RuvC [Chlamydiifrater phoenicopteri]|uniref:crossover junction endodeoxyribonuclease RuvC n=1 Tax=Chlamydiifrater phoenicopteri TaxID=2681469 RepID=UPI001BCF6C9C|nr:crossover junction endodeoxyribonuclease RuvC [Chlamydiifrater phoenicopteri]
MADSSPPKDLILGIDPGTVTTGYAFLQVEKRYRFVPYKFGKIEPSSKLSLTQRYRVLFENMRELVMENNPSVVVLETQFVHKNPQSTIKLGMARGVLVLAASLSEIPVFEYPPAVAKVAVVGKGNAKKEQVQLMTSRLLGLPELLKPSNEDVADAFALAICHAQSRNRLVSGVVL